jgi:SAM-dependent methyltransferase
MSVSSAAGSEVQQRERELSMSGEFGEYYGAIINWEKRLAREMPLLEELARQAGPRVLVPACGPGAHIVALAERGYKVLGFDRDEAALETAQSRIQCRTAAIAAAGGEARVELLDMAEAHRLGPVHDVAFCLGNALPSLSAPGQLLGALKATAGALRPGGIFFTQNLNFDLRWKEKAHWFPLLSGETARKEVLLVKFADYEADFINFHGMFLTREKPHGAWQTQVRTTRWLPLFQERLSDFLHQAGFRNLRFWGDYAKLPFDADRSNDLLIAAEKI